MKKTMIFCLALLFVVGLAAATFAFKGPITAIDGAEVTMEVESQVPPWVEKGALAKTLGGLAKVQGVDGQKVSLKVRRSKAKDLTLGQSIEVKPKAADPSQMLQGC